MYFYKGQEVPSRLPSLQCVGKTMSELRPRRNNEPSHWNFPSLQNSDNCGKTLQVLEVLETCLPWHCVGRPVMERGPLLGDLS